MTWFKVDDGWWSHPKVIPLDSDIRGLWVSAGSWCAQHLTDGFMPDYALKMVTEIRGAKLKAATEELVGAGLWKRVSGGFQFHDWDKYQPTKEAVETKRAADRDRKAAARVRAESERKPRRLRSASAPPDPTRPVHTPIPPPYGDVVRELDDRVRADDANPHTLAATQHNAQQAMELLEEIDRRAKQMQERVGSTEDGGSSHVR